MATTTMNQKVFQIIDDKGKETYEAMTRQQRAGLKKSKRWKSLVSVKAMFSILVRIKTI